MSGPPAPAALSIVVPTYNERDRLADLVEGIFRGYADAGVDGELVIVGTRALPRELQTAVIHRLELPQGRFERRVRLPAGAYRQPRRAAANGCLFIRLDKVETFRG